MEFTIAMACFPLLFITVDLVMIDIWLYIQDVGLLWEYEIMAWFME